MPRNAQQTLFIATRIMGLNKTNMNFYHRFEIIKVLCIPRIMHMFLRIVLFSMVWQYQILLLFFRLFHWTADRFTNDFARNSNSMETLSCCNYVAGHDIAPSYCTCHDSTAVGPCTKFCSNRWVKVEVREKRNFHRTWIAIENPLMKRSPRMIYDWLKSNANVLIFSEVYCTQFDWFIDSIYNVNDALPDRSIREAYALWLVGLACD